MTVKTHTKPASKKPQPSNYGLDNKRLLKIHSSSNDIWKWASAEKITAEYQISSTQLDHFHSFYGMPRMVTGDKNPSPFSAIYSIPALEEILQTVPELND